MAVLPRKYVLITEAILPIKYRGIKILVAGSKIVKLKIALAAIKKTASSNSSQNAVLLV